VCQLPISLKREAIGSLMVNIDTARYCESEEEVDIDELEEEVATKGIAPKEIRDTRCFKCLGCELRLDPRAIDRSVNKVSAYFAVKISGTDHEPICDIGGYLRFINAKDRKGLYDQGSGFPYGYPSKLELTDKTPGGSGPLPGGEPTGGDGSGRRGSNGLTAKGKHNRTVKTLKLLVKHFMAFPEPEFRQSVLTVPGIGFSTYEKAFQCLKWRPGYEYKSIRIYYAEILWRNTLVAKNKIIIPTIEGKWEEGVPPKPSIHLEIDISQYSGTQKELTKKWVNQCINIAKSRDKTKTRPWLFFLGNQVEGDAFKFQLYKNDFRTFFVVNDNSFQKGFASSIAVRTQYPQRVESTITTQQEEDTVSVTFNARNIDNVSLSDAVPIEAEDLAPINESEPTSVNQLIPEISQAEESFSELDAIPEASATIEPQLQVEPHSANNLIHNPVISSDLYESSDEPIEGKTTAKPIQPIKTAFDGFIAWLRSKVGR
jgi:hypothetical protein